MIAVQGPAAPALVANLANNPALLALTPDFIMQPAKCPGLFARCAEPDIRERTALS